MDGTHGDGIPTLGGDRASAGDEVPTGPFLAAAAGRIREWVRNGGPAEREHPEFDALIEGVYRRSCLGRIGPQEMAPLREAFGNAFSLETLQGYAYRKPHGYAGDFEIIERIYTGHVSPSERFAAWDRYFQAQAGPQAVRNRKAYFVELFRRLPRPGGRPLEVLNLACGPGNDMRELLGLPESGDLRIDCVDQDPMALTRAYRACRGFGDRIRFFQGNAVTFKPGRAYDIIWSAGLFDYFGDGLFRRVLRNLLPALRPGGRLVVGNFDPSNPSRAYMHLFDWPLRYRAAGDLRGLALACGAPPERVRVGQEPLGINLFLHVAAPGTPDGRLEPVT
jgi:SAM-dependent methyltransferase